MNSIHVNILVFILQCFLQIGMLRNDLMLKDFHEIIPTV